MLTSTALTPGHQPVPGTCVPSKVGNRVWPLKDVEYQPGVIGGVGGGGGGGGAATCTVTGGTAALLACTVQHSLLACTVHVYYVMSYSLLNFFSLKSLEGELQCGPLAQQWVLAP